MTQQELITALEELAGRMSAGWHEGIEIDASDIMLLNDAASAVATISRLREYARHKRGCDSRFSYDTEPGSLPCDCGYDKLMKELEESK